MIVNEYRAKGDLNHWAIRPEVEPQLRRWWSNPPLPQPPFLQSSGDHPQLVPATSKAKSDTLCEPRTRSKRTASQKSPRMTAVSVLPSPTLGINQLLPQPTLPSSVGKDTTIIGDHLNVAIREDVGLQQRLRDCSTSDSSNHMMYTKAAVLSARGIVGLGVKIDRSSVHNLLPRSLASRLRLPLHFGKSIRIEVDNHIFPANQYCRFNIRVAGVETTIDACVVSELPSLLLGREWIRQINLLSDFGNHKYYILGLYGNLIQVIDLGTSLTTEIETSESITATEIRTSKIVAVNKRDESDTTIDNDEI